LVDSAGLVVVIPFGEISSEGERMTAGVLITRLDLSASALRDEAARVKDASQARRLLALAFVLDGWPRQRAAKACGMDRQSLRDWVYRYNEGGIAALVDRQPPGAARRLTPEQEAELAALVEKGPDPAVNGVVRWRRVDLRDQIKEKFGVCLHERSVGRLLRRLRFSRMTVRPQHPEADVAAQEAFKKTSPSGSRPRSRRPRPASRSRSGSRTRPASARRDR
jgi:transposase